MVITLSNLLPTTFLPDRFHTTLCYHRPNCFPDDAKMKRLLHGLFPVIFFFSFSTSCSLATDTTTSVFINSRRGGANTKTQQIQKPPQKTAVVVSTAADVAIAMNSLAFMNTLCGRKNTADVKTFTQAITSSMGHTNNSMQKKTYDSSIEKRNNASEGDDDSTLPSWTFLSVLFRNEDQVCRPEISPENDHHDSNSNNIHTTTKTTTTTIPPTTSHETVAEYIGKLWFLPKNKGTIKFRETIRILSLGLDGGTSTVECHTQYYNGQDWIDCSKVICHFSSVSSNHEEGIHTNVNDHDAASSSSSMLQKVKMTLDCKLLVWLPLPSVASKAVQKKISSVFEEIVAEFFHELAMA
jgi:hypothetical protein